MTEPAPRLDPSSAAPRVIPIGGVVLPEARSSTAKFLLNLFPSAPDPTVLGDLRAQ